MSEQHPSTLSIEIDRDRLRNYLRVKWLFSWMLPLCFMGGVFGLAGLMRVIDHGLPTRSAVLRFVAEAVGISLGVTLVLSLFCYFIFSHRLAARLAASLEVTVEGAFLRIRQHTTTLSDRKLHFRSIVDYATTQDFLMRRFGIHALQMATTAGGQNASLTIPGVKDCLKVRDLLAEIDRQRENL